MVSTPTSTQVSKGTTRVVGILQAVTALVVILDILGFFVLTLFVWDRAGGGGAVATASAGVVATLVTYSLLAWAGEVLKTLVRIADGVWRD